MTDDTTEHTTPTGFEAFRLYCLPGYAKIFVGIFTTLMIFVCLWAMWIFYESKGKINQGTVPPYLSADSTRAPVNINDVPKDAIHDIEEIESDTAAVHAPEWDTAHAGIEEPVDSSDIDRIARLAITSRNSVDTSFDARPSKFRHNLGLAHTHINGQTLLYFAIGFIFLFTSATPKLKKIIYWIFGLSILIHVIGLTGQGFYSIFDDLLAISGVLILVTIIYMAFLIFVDLAKKPRTTA